MRETKKNGALCGLLAAALLAFAIPCHAKQDKPASGTNPTSGGGTTTTTTGGGGTTTTTTTTTTTDAGTTTVISTQDNFAPGNQLDVRVNGQPANSDGRDHNIDGSLATTSIATAPEPTITGGYLYDYNTVVSGQNTYMIETRTPVNSDGTPVAGVTPVQTGVSYMQQTDGTYLKTVPGAAMADLTVEQVTGTGGNANVGIAPDGIHDDSQLAGGISNTQTEKSEILDALIKSLKGTADAFIDLSLADYAGTNTYTDNPGGKYGTVESPKVVYATGKKDPTSGQIIEGNLQLAGKFEGFGILIVETDDPNVATLIMGGQATWTGLVIVVSNKVLTIDNKSMFQTVGGGNEVHIVGGAFLYNRNEVNPADPNATMLGKKMAILSGQSDVKYSSVALDLAYQLKPSGMEVHSWRKVQE